MTEVIVTDPNTGGQKASKLARFDLLPAGPLWHLAEHYGKGILKGYEARNWERGYKWSLSFAALMRHAWAFWRGETYDVHGLNCVEGCTEHTGSHHMVCAAWHALALVEFTQSHSQGDDRPKSAS